MQSARTVETESENEPASQWRGCQWVVVDTRRDVKSPAVQHRRRHSSGGRTNASNRFNVLGFVRRRTPRKTPLRELHLAACDTE
jgi:hypothetical protein